MKAFLKKHRIGAVLALILLWCLWYSRPVDIHFLLGDTSPNWTIGSIRDATSVYSTQFRTLDPGNDQEAGRELGNTLWESPFAKNSHL